MIQSVAANPGKRLYKRKVVSRVVELAVGICYRADQSICVQSGHAPQRFFPRQELARRDTAWSREPVIDFQSNVQVRDVDPVVTWYEELQLSGQVGRVFQHADAFVQGAYQDMVFLKIKSLDGLFQVPHSAVNDLGRCAGC